jgi:hypothetical protein
MHRAACLWHQLHQQPLRLLAVIGPGRLDERDRPRKGRAITVSDRGGEVVDPVGH